jgi:hypothetical protein
MRNTTPNIILKASHIPPDKGIGIFIFDKRKQHSLNIHVPLSIFNYT